MVEITDTDEPEVINARMRRVAIFSRFSMCTRIVRRLMDVSFIVSAMKDFVSMRGIPIPPAKNESMTWGFENARATVVVRQITGAIARRIVGWSQVGDELKKGDRFGMIRFGSRTEVYLPMSAAVTVKVGDRVAGGASTIARLS